MDLPVEEARAVLRQLSIHLDPLSLKAWLVKRTDYGRKPGPTPWANLEAFMSDYAGRLGR